MNQASNNINETLLLRFLLGETSPQETQKVEDWLELSEDNRKVLDQYEMLWGEAGKLTPEPVTVDTDNAWNNLENRIDEYERQRNKKLLLSPKILIPAAAIAATLLFFIPRWLSVTGTSPDTTVTLASHQVLEKDTLSDGTRITLNEFSSIKYAKNYGQKERNITLEGEAYFEAAKDTSKPLVIHTASAWVKVIGTKFNINARDNNDVEVYVKEGEVLLACTHTALKDTASIKLLAGETGKWIKSTNTLTKYDVPEPEVMSWLKNTFIFRDTPLQKVFNTLESHFEVNIMADPNLLEGCRLTTTFENQDFEEIMEVIISTFELSYSKNENSYKIKGNGCS